MGPGDIAEGILEPTLGVVDDVAAEIVAALLQTLAMRGDEIHATQNLERLVHAGHVRIAVDGLAEYAAERGRARLEHLGDAPIDRCAAKVRRERRADRAQIHVTEFRRKGQAVVAGEWVALVDVSLR